MRISNSRPVWDAGLGCEVDRRLGGPVVVLSADESSSAAANRHRSGLFENERRAGIDSTVQWVEVRHLTQALVSQITWASVQRPDTLLIQQPLTAFVDATLPERTRPIV